MLHFYACPLDAILIGPCRFRDFAPAAQAISADRVGSLTGISIADYSGFSSEVWQGRGLGVALLAGAP